MAKEKLEHRKIESIETPSKPYELFDTVVSGLGVRVSKVGSKTFFYRYRFHGKNKRYTIGAFPFVSLSEARNRARELKAEILKGYNPQGIKDKRKEVPEKIFTFLDLCERFKKRHLPTLRPKTQTEYNRIIDKELIPILGNRGANDIKRKEIIDLLDSIAIDRGALTLSNRVRATLSSIYSFGIDRAIVEANPILNIRRKKNENKRDRVYSHEELRELWKAFESQAEPVQTIYKILLLLGQRSGETRRLKWSDIDFNEGVWTIPKEQTKANRTHIVPLSKMALDLLENIKPLTGKSEYVFQSPVLENTPIEHLQKATARIKKESGVSDFRVHDLRRTMASYMAEIGIERTVLGKVLNHKGLAGDDQVTAIYDRYDYLKEKNLALENWAIQLNGILTGTKANMYKIGS